MTCVAVGRSIVGAPVGELSGLGVGCTYPSEGRFLTIFLDVKCYICVTTYLFMVTSTMYGNL